MRFFLTRRRLLAGAAVATIIPHAAFAQVTGDNKKFSLTLDTTAPPERLYALWSDARTWKDWDPLVERASLNGVGVGAKGKLKGVSGPESTIEVLVAEPGKRFVFAATGLGVRILYEREYAAGAVARITHRVTFSGPVGSALSGSLGPRFRAGLPEQMQRLIAKASA
jgi:hypothetical protein